MATKFDQSLDQVTLDYIDGTANGEDLGEWHEDEDSRTAVRMILEIEYAKWWGNPLDGSRIKELLTRRRPATGEELRDETKRALQVLVDDGVITDLNVTLDKDESERTVLLLTYRERNTGRAIDLVYSPFGG